jgi:hypothetical protein
MNIKLRKNPFDFLVSSNRRGQGLSLNVIIVAALALIVLVVLIAVFTGRLGLFQKQLGGEAKAELDGMRAFYGPCKPSAGAEAVFGVTYEAAAKLESIQEQASGKAEAKSEFDSILSSCKSFSDRDSCEGESDCSWRG